MLQIFTIIIDGDGFSHDTKKNSKNSCDEIDASNAASPACRSPGRQNRQVPATADTMASICPMPGPEAGLDGDDRRPAGHRFRASGRLVRFGPHRHALRQTHPVEGWLMLAGKSGL